MPNKEPIIDHYYWDSCVFLYIIEGDAERMPVIEGLLNEAESGSIEIYTSTLSMVEVAYAKSEKNGKKLSKATEARINKLWLTTSPFKLIDFYPIIAADAKKLMREAIPNDWSLKPADAIHLATSKRFGITEFHTYDTALYKYSKTVGIKILEPHGNNIPFPS